MTQEFSPRGTMRNPASETRGEGDNHGRSVAATDIEHLMSILSIFENRLLLRELLETLSRACLISENMALIYYQ